MTRRRISKTDERLVRPARCDYPSALTSNGATPLDPDRVSDPRKCVPHARPKLISRAFNSSEQSGEIELRQFRLEKHSTETTLSRAGALERTIDCEGGAREGASRSTLSLQSSTPSSRC